MTYLEIQLLQHQEMVIYKKDFYFNPQNSFVAADFNQFSTMFFKL